MVPLVIEEPGSAAARAWLEEDPEIATWAWTRVEIASALERRIRERRVSPRERRELLRRIELFARSWEEVVDVLAVRSRAISLLARYPLRAADAAQLGAALLAAEGDPGSLPFACLDERLAEAAEREGFPLLGASSSAP